VYLPFGKKGINESLGKVFIFEAELFDLLELFKQFFVGELPGHCFIFCSLH